MKEMMDVPVFGDGTPVPETATVRRVGEESTHITVSRGDMSVLYQIRPLAVTRRTTGGHEYPQAVEHRGQPLYRLTRDGVWVGDKVINGVMKLVKQDVTRK